MNNILIVIGEWSTFLPSKWQMALTTYPHDIVILLYLIYPPIDDQLEDVITLVKPKIYQLADALKITRDNVNIVLEIPQSFISLRKLITEKQVKNIIVDSYPKNPLNSTKIHLILSNVCQIHHLSE